MILHCVHCAVRGDADADDLAAVMAELAALVGEVDGMTDLRHGVNRDFEGKSAGFPYGFVATFRDRAALAAYDAHPRHRAAARRLVAACEGGADGIVVHDLDVG